MSGGLLRRVARGEIEAAAAQEGWWEDVLARVAEEGGLRGLVREQGWGWGALMGWIRADEVRSEQYERALRDYAHWCVLETVGIADGVVEDKAAIAKAKLRADVRHWAASRWDRGRYGEQVKVNHSGVMPVLNIVVVGQQEERVIEQQLEVLASERDDGGEI